jgi:hypothetical protein
MMIHKDKSRMEITHLPKKLKLIPHYMAPDPSKKQKFIVTTVSILGLTHHKQISTLIM